MVAQVEVVVVVGLGVAGGVVDQTADLEREEEVGVVVMTTMRTTMEVPVAVQDVVVVVVAELEGDEEAGVHHRRHHLVHRLPQTTCWTRTFSLVSLFYTFRPSGLYLIARR